MKSLYLPLRFFFFPLPLVTSNEEVKFTAKKRDLHILSIIKMVRGNFLLLKETI